MQEPALGELRMTKSGPAADTDRNKIGNVGFAASPVLPGEDGREFVMLFTRLAEEHAAEGDLEFDAVLTMATSLWRKQNLSVYKLAAEARARYGGFFNFPNDRAGFLRYISRESEKLLLVAQATVEERERRLKDDEATQSNGENGQIENCIHLNGLANDPRLLGTEETRMSVMAEATELMTAFMSEILDPEILEELKQVAEDRVRDPLINLARLGTLITPECLSAELDMIERLDAAIDRSHSRLKKYQAARTKSSAPPSVSPLLQHTKR
jgi:hypothetical protein